MTPLYALHGFLGCPEDWDFLSVKNASVIPIDLFRSPFLPPDQGLKHAARLFNAYVSKNSSKNILMGYSLGARICMHALIDAPHLWKAGILISGHPGLLSPQDKLKRLQEDTKWSQRFEKESWSEIMQSWNAQSVFSSTAMPPTRKEKTISRTILASVLKNWSLGTQDYLLPDLTKLTLPILWIAGQQDQKYSSIAQEVQLKHPHSRIWLAPNSHHRVPWEETQPFLTQLNQFLEVL